MTTTTIRQAIVRGNVTAEVVARYMPSNYGVTSEGTDGDGPYVVIAGHDQCGWTLEDYVIPRLASGLFWAREVV